MKLHTDIHGLLLLLPPQGGRSWFKLKYPRKIPPICHDVSTDVHSSQMTCWLYSQSLHVGWIVHSNTQNKIIPVMLTCHDLYLLRSSPSTP